MAQRVSCLLTELLACCSQTPEDHENSRQVAQRFLEKDGPVLYEKLKDYAKDRDSYIEEFWVRPYKSLARWSQAY